MTDASPPSQPVGSCTSGVESAYVAGLRREIEGLTEATRLHGQALEVLSSLLAERHVWLVMAGGRHATLVAGPFGSAEDAESAREQLIEEATADGQWGRIHPDATSAWDLYRVHRFSVEYPLGWTE